MTSMYLAGRFSRREELRGIRDELQAMGHTVTSRWLESHEDDGECTDEYLADCAQDDLDDIDNADMLIAFTEPHDSPHNRGGRHVELGFALANCHYICVVGYRENVFCHLPFVTFYADTGEMLRSMARWASDDAATGQRALEGVPS